MDGIPARVGVEAYGRLRGVGVRLGEGRMIGSGRGFSSSVLLAFLPLDGAAVHFVPSDVLTITVFLTTHAIRL